MEISTGNLRNLEYIEYSTHVLCTIKPIINPALQKSNVYKVSTHGKIDKGCKYDLKNSLIWSFIMLLVVQSYRIVVGNHVYLTNVRNNLTYVAGVLNFKNIGRTITN